MLPKPLQGRLGMVVQVFSLLATGCIVWNTVVGPRLLHQPVRAVIGDAVFYALLAWFWSAAIALLLFLVLPRAEAGRMLWSTLRTSAVAVWFAPACILLSHLSPATLLASLALVVTATRLLYSEWLASRPPAPAEPAPAVPIGMFGENAPERPAITREQATGIAAALAMQLGVVSVWRHQPLLAGSWFVMSAAIVTLFAMVSGAVEHTAPPSLPRAALGILATIFLAAGVTVGGLHLSRRLRGTADGDPGSGGVGAVASAREVLRDLFGDEAKPGEKAAAPQNQTGVPAPVPGNIAYDGSFPGVILWPEVRPVTRLVAPLPRSDGTGIGFARAFAIPFDGRYLFYRWPYLRPPDSSVLERGSPSAVGFSTTDHWPLNMDAVQRFDQPVDLLCCTRVRVDVWNADRYPGTVTLELFADGKSLGSAPVRSSPNLNQEPVLAVPETLDFPIGAAGGPCSELKVAFRRARKRADKSARIAIERFVLDP